MLKLTQTLTISRMGAQGDGIASSSDNDGLTGDVFVPGTLAGERVSITRDGGRGDLVEVLTASPERVEPICHWVGRCGGCALQHWQRGPYEDWKRQMVITTLAQANIEPHRSLQETVHPTLAGHGEGRRRVTLHARREATGWQVGFMERRSHTIIAIDHCPLLVPALADAPGLAQTLVEALGGDKPLDVHLTATISGLDVDIRGHGPASDGKRRVLADVARRLGLARLAIHGDVIVQIENASVRIGAAEVVAPPGAFLQATEAGEWLLAEKVLAAVGKSKRVLDLFAGVGTFALRLAEKATVHAVETDAKALAALDRGWREAKGLRSVTCETRDLFRRPLIPTEMTAYDAVVFDPPRAGAEAQSRQLAKSDVARIVAVSCNIASFARDAKILMQGGYQLNDIWPVNQFLYSPHVEVVGLFERPPAAKKVRRLLG